MVTFVASIQMLGQKFTKSLSTDSLSWFDSVCCVCEIQRVVLRPWTIQRFVCIESLSTHFFYMRKAFDETPIQLSTNHFVCVSSSLYWFIWYSKRNIWRLTFAERWSTRAVFCLSAIKFTVSFFAQKSNFYFDNHYFDAILEVISLNRLLMFNECVIFWWTLDTEQFTLNEYCLGLSHKLSLLCTFEPIVCIVTLNSQQILF